MSTFSSRNSIEKPVEDTTSTKLAQAPEYPSNGKRIILMTAVYLALFLVTLDQNIISTAIPRITDEFHSLDDVGWYGSAYLLAMCSFQLLMGKVYKFYPAKRVFLGGCFLFEVGSAVCGAAPNSTAFIVGRFISGAGSSAIFAGIMVILFHTVPLQQRPIYQGLFGAIFALGSVVGPLLGGTFTDKVTWRWCFYINLPLGGVSLLVTTLILHLPNQKLDVRAKGWSGKLKQLDPIGNLVFLPGIICLILALQWGGTKYAWKDARIIVLFVLCGILCAVFVGIQIWKQEEATVPPRIVKQRSIVASAWYGFFQNASTMVMMYYLPIWFQAIKDVSALRSGIMLLPFILSTVVASITSGIIISKVGYYTPFLWLSSILMPIAAGLFTTFTPTTGSAKWIGYQILLGIGSGVGSQQPLNVVQTILERPDIATGSALMMFTRFLGSSIFLSVAENLFLNKLASKLTSLPGIDVTAITSGGATQLRTLATGNNLKTILTDYNSAIVDVFDLVVAMLAVTVLGTAFVEWRSLKKRANEQTGKSDALRDVEKSTQVEETIDHK